MGYPTVYLKRWMTPCGIWRYFWWTFGDLCGNIWGFLDTFWRPDQGSQGIQGNQGSDTGSFKLEHLEFTKPIFEKQISTCGISSMKRKRRSIATADQKIILYSVCAQPLLGYAQPIKKFKNRLPLLMDPTSHRSRMRGIVTIFSPAHIESRYRSDGNPRSVGRSVGGRTAYVESGHGRSNDYYKVWSRLFSTKYSSQIHWSNNRFNSLQTNFDTI